MSTRQATVDFILEQSVRAGTMRARKMFGEYALYCDEKLVALVCDDQLFIKPTDAGREFIGRAVMCSPYSGAKPYFLIAESKLENGEWLSSLIEKSAAELPPPAKKKPKAKARRKS